jgi:hypothetical protein
MTKRTLLAGSVLVFLLIMLSSSFFVQAGERTLSLNNGTNSSTWFITGENTLVMNGFDLTQLGLRFPAIIDRAAIDIDIPVPGQPVDVVVYQDSNGGSPVDATLAGQTQVTIAQSGVFTVTFPTPIQITQPVVWVGFYMPVNMQFRADTSGSSVLTYWAWTPNSRFDLARLSSATVFGPSNGTAPVSINMGGIARITVEISNGTGAGLPTTIPVTLVNGTPVATGVAVPAGFPTQIPSAADTSLSPLRVYPPACDTLFWDTADTGISYRERIEPRCTAIWPGYAPGAPVGYQRRQLYYDITFYGDNGLPISDALPVPVTHCIKANPADLNVAVIGLASGAPRSFRVLPTLRVGELICAEINQSGGISYFVPG